MFTKKTMYMLTKTKMIIYDDYVDDEVKLQIMVMVIIASKTMSISMLTKPS